MPCVSITPNLYPFFPSLQGRSLEVEGDTVAQIVAGLELLAPGIAFYLCDERGRLRRHVNIFIGDQAVCDRHSLSDEVSPDARVSIFQALSGG